MYENNVDNFNYKPLTLYNFFPKNKRLKNSNQDSSSNSNHHHLGYTNSARGSIEKNFSNKNSRLSNSKNNYKVGQNTKNFKFSSTSKNFYHNHNNNHNNNHNHNEYYYNGNSIKNKKYSINSYNMDKFSFRKYSQKKNRTKDKDKIRRQENIGYVNFHNFHNIDNKEMSEQFLEKFLEDNDSKVHKNIKEMKTTFTNNMFKNSLKANKNYNEYINSLRIKNMFKLNNKDKIYDYLPYLHSATKDKKQIPKTQKQLLVYDNINTMNPLFKPINGDNKFHSSAQTLIKSNNDKNNSNKINNFIHASSNNTLNGFNNNIITNSNISNTGNNNIIFNNMGSVNNNYNYNIFEDSSRKNNNYFDEISRTNTAGKDGENHYNIFGKASLKNTLFNSMKKESENINDINEDKKSDQKIIRNFKFLREDKNGEKEKEADLTNSNTNKVRAFSTAPHKTRNKNETNINSNNDNQDRQITNENNNKIKSDFESNKKMKKEREKYKLSKYEIGESLGKGAYAVVKLVTNKITNEKFAMKVYEKEKLNSNSKKGCVFKEIQILKKLKHKNIVKLIEVISTEKQILIVQELIEGISLREYYNNEIRHQKGISIHKENIFRIIFKQIFDAMNYVHKLGMAHRDIKLENILIKKNYEIKIIDFGFGMYNPENKLEKFFCGTPNYMAPEIAEKKPYIGQLADMWSLGILVYKIFCADFPFKGKNEKELYKAIKTGKFTMASYTPEYAKKIINSLIVLDPNKRISCEDVLNSDWLKDK